MLDSIEIDDKKNWDVNMVATNEHSVGMRHSSVSKSARIKEQIENTLVIDEDIEVTEYSPDVFAFLR